MTLLEAIANAEPGTIPKTPFYAELQGEQVLVRCVLERTAVYERDGDRHLELLAKFIPVGELEWFQPEPRRGTGLKLTNGARAERGRQAAMRITRQTGPPEGPLPEGCMGGRWCGTSGGYDNHRCRGEHCRTAATARSRERRLARVEEAS